MEQKNWISGPDCNFIGLLILYCEKILSKRLEKGKLSRFQLFGGFHVELLCYDDILYSYSSRNAAESVVLTYYVSKPTSKCGVRCNDHFEPKFYHKIRRPNTLVSSSLICPRTKTSQKQQKRLVNCTLLDLVLDRLQLGRGGLGTDYW